jgi:hypothetical protein
MEKKFGTLTWARPIWAVPGHCPHRPMAHLASASAHLPKQAVTTGPCPSLCRHWDRAHGLDRRHVRLVHAPLSSTTTHYWGKASLNFSFSRSQLDLPSMPLLCATAERCTKEPMVVIPMHPALPSSRCASPQGESMVRVPLRAPHCPPSIAARISPGTATLKDWGGDRRGVNRSQIIFSRISLCLKIKTPANICAIRWWKHFLIEETWYQQNYKANRRRMWSITLMVSK